MKTEKKKLFYYGIGICVKRKCHPSNMRFENCFGFLAFIGNLIQFLEEENREELMLALRNLWESLIGNLRK